MWKSAYEVGWLTDSVDWYTAAWACSPFYYYGFPYVYGPSVVVQQVPVYSYYDMVHLNYRLLRDHLKIGQVVLATGVSMGGTQSYYWGLMYPDFVKAVTADLHDRKLL